MCQEGMNNMDAAWIKEQSDFIMMGMGFMVGLGIVIFRVTKWALEKKNGPSDSNVATSGDIKSLMGTVERHGKRSDKRFDAVDGRMDKQEETTANLGEKIGTMQSDGAVAAAAIKNLESWNGELAKKSTKNGTDIARIEGEMKASNRQN